MIHCTQLSHTTASVSCQTPSPFNTSFHTPNFSKMNQLNPCTEKQRKITSVNVFFASVHFACRSAHLACNCYERERKESDSIFTLITPVMDKSSIGAANSGWLLNNKSTITNPVFACHQHSEHLIAGMLIEYLINNSKHFPPDLLHVLGPRTSSSFYEMDANRMVTYWTDLCKIAQHYLVLLHQPSFTPG